VQALVGIGHGDAPQGNWAMAGLVLGLGKAKRTAQGTVPAQHRYFTGLDLHKVQQAQHIAMSCCVLGRVRDSQGEPMGMTALAFGYKARMAVGAVVPIPDYEGALFSMATHWAWQQDEQTALARGQALDWSGSFHATRRSVMALQWPQGFGAWLVANLEALAMDNCDGLAGPRSQALDAYAGLPAVDVAAYIARLAAAPTQAVADVAAMFVCLG
jgi:hypothetical protein